MAKGDLLTLNLSTAGEKSMSFALQVPIDAIKDMDPAWEEIRDDFLEREEDWLLSEGEGTFVALSPEYLKEKRAVVGDKRILEYFGRLFDSLTKVNDRDFIYETERLAVVMGTRVDYARFHQNPQGSLPRRPPLISPTRERALAWAKIIQTHLFRSGQLVRAPALEIPGGGGR